MIIQFEKIFLFRTLTHITSWSVLIFYDEYVILSSNFLCLWFHFLLHEVIDVLDYFFWRYHKVDDT